jgi:MFS family permease
LPEPATPDRPGHRASRLPFSYGWLIVGIGFVRAIGVTARTAFSPLMPPLLDEFHRDRGLAAGAFSFGFLVSAVLGPLVGRAMDARGPRIVIMIGVVLLSPGLFLAPAIEPAMAALHHAWRSGWRRCQHVPPIIGCCAASAAAIWIAAPRRVENLRDLRFGFRNALLAFSMNGK